MTIAAAFVGEVRPTNGSDSNGGGFVAGSSGLDFSQQNAAQLTYTDLKVDAVTATKVTSAAHPFNGTHVGNILNQTGGTGFTVSRFQVVAVVGVTATLDRAAGTLGSTGGTGSLGGAAQTPDVLEAMLNSVGAGGSKVYVKNEAVMVRTANLVLNAPAVTPAFNAPANRLVGYGSVRGDATRARIRLSANAGLTGIQATTNGWVVENFEVDCAGLAASTGVSVVNNSEVKNCRVLNFTTAGISTSSPNVEVWGSEVLVGSGTAGISVAGNSEVYANYVHDLTCPGVVSTAGTCPRDNLVVNCAGGTSDGIRMTNPGAAERNTVFNVGRYGIAGSSGNWYQWRVQNNLLALCGTAGFAGYTLTAGIPARSDFDGNAYWNNVADRLNCDDTTVNPVNGVSPYTNVADIHLGTSPSGNPFVRATVPVADLTVDGSNNLKVTSGSYSFVSSDAGATLYVTNQSGGWTLGQYTVASVSGGAAILTASPGATGSTGGNWYFDDFRLNRTAGAGLSLRGMGVPASLPGLSQGNFLSPGCYQEQSNISNSVVIPMGHGSVSLFPGDAYKGAFTTCLSDTRAAVNADSLPTATLVRNGTIDGAVAVTVANLAPGLYSLAATIPGGYSDGDRLQLAVTATVNAVAGTAVVDNFVLGVTYSSPTTLLLLGVG